VGGPIQSTPCVVGDTVFIGAWDGYYYAIDSASGALRWKFDGGVGTDPTQDDSIPRWGLRDMRSTAQYSRGRLYFGTGDGDLHCVDTVSGRGLWRTRLDPDPNTMLSSSPAVLGDRVFVGTSGDRAQIACLDADTGAVRWRFYIVPDRTDGGGSVWTSAAVDEEQGIVYNVTGNPRSFTPPGPLLYSDSIIANDLRTGELLWHYQARATDPFDLDFSCHPMLFRAESPGKRGAWRDCLGAGSKTAFHCCDRYTGEPLWKAMLTPGSIQGGPWMSSTAAAYNKVFLVSNAIEVDPGTGRSAGGSQSVTAALHAYTGEIVWWRHNPSMNRAPVCVAGGVFYQSLFYRTVEAFRVQDGRKIWETGLPTTSRGGVVVSNGALYVANGEAGGAEPKNRYYLFAYSLDGR